MSAAGGDGFVYTNVYARDAEGALAHGPMTFKAAESAHALATGDFTGRGLPSVLKTAFGSGRVLYAEMQREENTDLFDGGPQRLNLGFCPSALALADADGDGKADCLAIERTDAGPVLHVLLSKGDGTFRPAFHARLAGLDEVRLLAAADLDGDGKTDLVLFDGKRVALLYGEGGGRFGNK